MKKYLVSNNIPERMAFVKKSKPFGKRVAIYNHIPLRGLESYFDHWVKLSDLYNDEVFLNLLPKVDEKVSLFLIDMGIDYCSFQPNYIKPYTKLHPISTQAKDTFIIDGFAFYNTEKSIYRPFLYINPEIIGSSVQEFYNTGPYKDFEGNRIENYFKTIQPYMDVKTKPIEIEVIEYEPTEAEKKGYEQLKEQIILKDKFPKVKVLRLLNEYVENTKSKQKAIVSFPENVLNVTRNTPASRVSMYKEILLQNPAKVVFYQSNYYGADEIELGRTMEAIQRHNKLITLLNG